MTNREATMISKTIDRRRFANVTAPHKISEQD
jgi:hypothetical protein